MPAQVNNKGQWVQEYFGPYAGLNVQAPESLIPDNATPAMSNFLLRNAELRSLPVFSQKFSTPQVGTIVGIDSFLDINGTYHTVLFETGAVYQYNPATGPPPWDVITGTLPVIGPRPVSTRAFTNQLWMSNVSQFARPFAPVVAYWDGLSSGFVATQTFSDTSTSDSVAGISLTDSPTVGATLPGSPTVVGPLAIAGQYLGELNNQLILANIAVLDQNGPTLYSFPNMIWWCANGQPLIWDPTVIGSPSIPTGAGFTAFLDVPDQITGLQTLGVAGYIHRTNGITQFAPTGSSGAPWQFNHMWASEHGIGTVFPWSIAQYGPNGAFVAEDNIYLLSLTNATPIGGTARDAIMADLAANAALNPAIFAPVPVGTIIPKFNNGYVYLSYQLCIVVPVGIDFQCRIWNYSFEDKNWSQWDVPAFDPFTIYTITAPPNFV